MEEDQQYIVDDEPLKVLKLFPKREITDISLTVEKYQRIYEHLTCSLCQELLQTPVYLKCSHRFCKECIEKYIRTNNKKCCPICQGDLTTKRDLRNDYFTQTFLRLAFKDPKAFSSSMDRPDQVGIIKSKNPELKKSEMQFDRIKASKDSNEENQLNPPPIKRNKTEGDDIKKRKRMPSERRIDGKGNAEKEQRDIAPARRGPKTNLQKEQRRSEMLIKAEQISKLQQTKPPSQSTSTPAYELARSQIFRSEKKKKRIPIIQIDSNSEQPEKQVQEIRREEFLTPQDEDKNICSINAIAHPDIPAGQKDQIIAPEQSFQTPIKQVNKENIKNQAEQEEEMLPELESIVPEEEQMVDELLPIKSNAKESFQHQEVAKAIQLLTEQFGQNYQYKIIELTNFSFYADINIQKHPNSIFTPEVVRGSFQFYLRQPLVMICSMLAELLNTNKQCIRLYVSQKSQGGSYTELNPALKFYEVNQRYWRQWQGITLIELQQVLRSEDRGQSPWLFKIKQERSIFYAIDFSKFAH